MLQEQQRPELQQLFNVQRLKYSLERAVKTLPASVLLLSGGLDSSVLAALDPSIPAITVVLQGRGIDLRYAQQVAEYTGLPDWYPLEITIAQAMRDLPEIMRLSTSYDIAIKNNIPVYEGLKYAASLGFRNVRTGDASDELFAGYSWLNQMTDTDLKHWVQTAVPEIRLPSSQLGKAMNMNMNYPYLNHEVVRLALDLTPQDNIAEIDTDELGDFSQQFNSGEKRSKKWGKIILRKVAEGLLPNDIVWRTKTPIEYGSGMYTLELGLEMSLTGQEETRLRGTGKHFWSKAHGKLYLMFEDTDLSPQPAKKGEYACTWCGGGVIQGRHHCVTCGAYPSDTIPKASLFEKEYINK